MAAEVAWSPSWSGRGARNDHVREFHRQAPIQGHGAPGASCRPLIASLGGGPGAGLRRSRTVWWRGSAWHPTQTERRQDVIVIRPEVHPGSRARRGGPGSPSLLGLSRMTEVPEIPPTPAICAGPRWTRRCGAGAGVPHLCRRLPSARRRHHGVRPLPASALTRSPGAATPGCQRAVRGDRLRSRPLRRGDLRLPGHHAQQTEAVPCGRMGLPAVSLRPPDARRGHAAA